MDLARTFGLLAAPLCLTACFAPRIDGTARMTQLTLDGEIGISDSSIVTRNTIDDLGLGDKENLPGAVIDFQWGGPHISVSTMSGSWSGSGTLSAELSNNGATIPIGDNVDSDLDMAIHSAIITWDFLPTAAELGIGIGVDAFDLKGSFVSQSTSERIDFDEMVPIPVLAVRANVPVGPFEFGGHLAGFQIDYDGDEAQFMDLDVHGQWHVIGGSSRASGSIIAGYRKINLQVDYEGDSGERIDADLDFSGPFLGAQISF
ncbi:MAG: hypothetical protein R3F33_14745 [Planctomycetota bacterium]